MSREWKPGDVGLNESQGYRSIFIKRGDHGTCPAFHPDDPHWHTENGGYDHAPFDYRPLVVIDPEDREQVERLIDEWYAQQRQLGAPAHERMQAALRSLVTPPKPEVLEHLAVEGWQQGTARALCGKVWRPDRESVTVAGKCPECAEIAKAGWVA